LVSPSSFRDADLLRAGRLAEYGALAASAVHELSQPLLAIKALAQLLGDHPDPSVRERAQIIAQQSKRMQSIVAQHRGFLARDEEGKKPLQLADVVKEAVELTSHHARRCRATIELSVGRGVSEVLGLRHQLLHAVVNLLVNAADAVEAVGGGRVEVEVARDDGYVTVTVSDSGGGVAKAAEAKLFKIMFTTKGEDRGSGFGLFICQRVAENHGGRVDYVRPLGAAWTTQFRLTLPLADSVPVAATLRSVLPARPTAVPRAIPPADATVRAKNPERASKVRQRSILIVDDEPVVRLVLVELLKGDGYDLCEAPSAEEALQLIRKRSFDLLITDKNLSQMDGLGLIENARRLHPELRAMLITGYPSLVSARKALELGLIAYITKPFDDTKALRARIRAALAAPDATGAAASPPNNAVLVYEPREQQVQELTRALRSLGFEPIVAGDIESAKRLMQNGYAGAVVSWEAAEAIGNAAPNRRVVLMTDDVSFDKMVTAISTGAKACLPRNAGSVEQLRKELGRAFDVER